MDTEKHVQHIVHWLQEYKDQAGAKGGVVGLSGGLDSTVVAYLMKRAFGDNALGVLLPIHNSVEAEKDALLVARDSQINHIGIELTDTFKEGFGQIEKALGDQWNKDSAQLVGANFQARLRMSTLYAIAQNNQYLVIGTGNASELFTGYFTKYGDEGVDVNPLVNYRKEQVKEMAKYLGVPDRILDKAPSADLWEGQTDEKEMGISYAAIDKYLRGEEIPPEDEKTLMRLHKSSEHKRHLPPGPPKLDA
ncbi:NAD(+) synthase [Allobacillus sp. GCM10007491]|uniref:NH(3)-dependent NAD(+) synthetase n=1 Tax=Allobacillus saliphilus TaxID=2912308 RepID=A0A941HTV5_9BACI|nr:NAD(+) synthase [Allobacillus saliphilus]MBR7553674.1 NAD(+) synthase [Allobacillus saliphilus]